MKSRAKPAAHPEQFNGIQLMIKALDELRNGVAAAERMILTRTETRVNDDDQVGIREPLPRGALTAAKVAKSAVAQDVAVSTRTSVASV